MYPLGNIIIAKMVKTCLTIDLLQSISIGRVYSTAFLVNLTHRKENSSNYSTSLDAAKNVFLLSCNKLVILTLYIITLI